MAARTRIANVKDGRREVVSLGNNPDGPIKSAFPEVRRAALSALESVKVRHHSGAVQLLLSCGYIPE